MDRLRVTGNYIEDVNNGLAPIKPPPSPMGGISALLRAAGGETRYNLPNADVGDGNRGYVVDMNGNGQYNRGQDAILGLDFDGDGNLNQVEIDRSRGLFSNWGDSKYDRNHDGKMSNEELNEAGGRAWVDRNCDGQISNSEVNTVNDFGPNHSRIHELDPERRRTEIGPNPRPELPRYGIPTDAFPKMSDDEFRKWKEELPRVLEPSPKGDGPLSPNNPWGNPTDPMGPKDPWAFDKPIHLCPGPNDPRLGPREGGPSDRILNPQPNDGPNELLPYRGPNPLRSKPQDMLPGSRDDLYRPGSSVHLGTRDDLHRPGDSRPGPSVAERTPSAPRPAPAKPRSSTPSRGTPSRSSPPKPKSAK